MDYDENCYLINLSNNKKYWNYYYRKRDWVGVMRNTRKRRIDKRKPTGPLRKALSTAVLAAGLALGGCCAKAPVQKPKVGHKAKKKIFGCKWFSRNKKKNIDLRPIYDACDNTAGDGTPFHGYRHGTCKMDDRDSLRGGNILYATTIHYRVTWKSPKKSMYIRYDVNKIDDRGVVIGLSASSPIGNLLGRKNGLPLPMWKIKFGETKRIGEVKRPGMDKPFTAGTAIVHAEKGREPGTAILTIRWLKETMQ